MDDEMIEILHKNIKESIAKTKKKIAHEEYNLAIHGTNDGYEITEYEKKLNEIEILERLLDKFQKMLRKKFGE